MLKKNGFSLLEVLIVCLIIAIIASIAIATYQRAAEKSDQLLCETREKLIYTAIKIYGLENAAIPASLSEVWPQYKDKALAELREENRRLGFSSIRNWALPKVAEAQDFSGYYGKDITIITCPSDKTPPPGGISYTINPALAGQPLSALEANEEVLLIYEVDTEGGEMAYRHKIGRSKICNSITLKGKPKKQKKPKKP